VQGVLLAERFRIRDRLGAGGMGEVWSAQDERMRRDVAVKLVHALFGMDEPETRARFQREVQLAGRLSHQNIVTVHDWGEVPVGGRPVLYLVMELVPGVSLRQRLKEATPAWPLAVGWAAQIARALDAAHRQGVIHRDIKPANVLLTPEGTAKVLDFGVAKFMGDTMSVHELTVTGALLGSPPYMSPEQAEGAREIDHRSDLYSLGCLLYHAVTGRPPFTSTTPLAVLRMQMEDAPTPPGALVEGLPASLNDLILNLLAKRPEHRPANAAAVHDALSTVLVDQIVTPSGASILEVAQLGHPDGVAGRFLTKAWRLWQRVEAHSTASREEAYALLAQTRAEAEGFLERTRTEAEQLLGTARTEAHQVVTAARKEAAMMVTASTKETERLRAEAVAEAERLRAEARDSAEQLMDRTRQDAQGDTQRNRARTVERLAEAGLEQSRRLRAEVERLHATRTGGERQPGGAASAAEELVRLKANIPNVPEPLAQQTVEAPWWDQISESSRPQTEDNSASTDAGFDRIRSELRDLRMAGISQARHGTKPVPPAPVSFDLVRRGYHRAQVDDRIAKLTADQNLALFNVADLEERIDDEVRLLSEDQSKSLALTQDQVKQFLDDVYAYAERTAPRPLQPQQGDSYPPYGFELVRRGYDRAQVDDHISKLVVVRDSALTRVILLEGILESLRAAQAS